MSLVIGFLTFILVVDCFFLMLLILIQLPKKEAGAGIAFGGGATDALFGAGTGNALTKMTKYTATIFLGLALSLSLLNSHQALRKKTGVDTELLKKQSSQTPLAPPPMAGTNANPLLLAPTQSLQSVTGTTATNPPAVTTTNLVVPASRTNAEAPSPAPPSANPAAPSSPGAAPKPN